MEDFNKKETELRMVIGDRENAMEVLKSQIAKLQ